MIRTACISTVLKRALMRKCLGFPSQCAESDAVARRHLLTWALESHCFANLSPGSGLGNLEILAQHGDLGTDAPHNREAGLLSITQQLYRLYFHCRKNYRDVRVLMATFKLLFETNPNKPSGVYVIKLKLKDMSFCEPNVDPVQGKPSLTKSHVRM